jgi:hypothetical protein
MNNPVNCSIFALSRPCRDRYRTGSVQDYAEGAGIRRD